MTANFSGEILKDRKSWNDIFQVHKENNFHQDYEIQQCSPLKQKEKKRPSVISKS
jgi:hypothetical protein